MIAIRPATADDVPALGRLGTELVATHHGFDASRFIAAGPETPRGYGAFLAGEMARDEAIVLVAADADGVAGYAYAALEGADWMTLRGPAGVIYDLVVDPGRRGGGVGRRLLAEMLARLEAAGAPQVVLSAAQQNEGAQRLFTAFGFRRTLIEMTREVE
ncbi:GNAT family N-acetyltransferase [Phenylobacterium sp.]|jgi:ribosomal protein S18 acetylase RimI-like enzyme|uniref:GNAT family N-acetyltransferase n=1 Tax=Phenylobacterium sp. TaxID=1871053 RepID=UPI0037831B29